MNIIDSLIVTLGLDPSGYVKGTETARAELKKMTDEEVKAAKQQEAATNNRTEAYRKLATEVLGLFAVFTAGRGVADFVRDITSGDAATGRLAHNLNMTTDALAAWEEAGKRSGATAAGIDAAFSGLSDQLNAFPLTGNAGVLPFFKQLQINVTDANLKLRPMADLFLDLSKKFSERSLPESLAIGKMMGMDAGTVDFLHQGPAAVQKALEAARQLGVPNDGDAKNAQKLINDLLDLQQAVTSLARTTLNDLSPSIDAALTGMVDWLKTNRQWLADNITDQIKDLVTSLKSVDWQAISVGLKSFGDGADAAAHAVGGWKDASEALLALWLGSKFAGALANVGKLGLALGVGIDQALRALDPGDNAGSWIDQNIPGAAAIDNFFSQFGLGRSYQQQGAAASAGGKAGPTTAEQDKLSTQAIDYFVSKGWTPEQAAGIVGNLQQESGFNPQAGAGTAHQGLAQWSAERQRDIEQHFGKALLSMSNQEQLAAIQWELTQGKYKAAGDALRQAKSARDAAAVIDHQYESPGNYAVEDKNRGANADARLNAYRSNAETPPPNTDTGSPTSSWLWDWLHGKQSGATPPPPPAGPPSADARYGSQAGGSVSNDNSTEVNFHGPITVNSQATDAKGVANDLRGALSDRFAVQANSGLV